jgi:hypothetical protein
MGGVMSRDRGIRLQNALAAYLKAWWPAAESAGSGRPGRDVLNTPGVWWECKTEADGEHRPGQFMRQAVKGAAGDLPAAEGDLPVVVWFPPGAADPGKAIAMLPLPELMMLLTDCGFAPPREGVVW